MRILLFDIDGTLIRSGGAGKMAMENGLRTAFGIHEILGHVPYSGRTDPGISRDLLRVHDIEPSLENVQRLKSAYLSHLPDALRNHEGMVLPAVEETLRKHSRDDIALGLLTGNILAGAEIKLRHFGLWDYFRFGGFGDDLTDRDDVARRAREAGHKHLARIIDPQAIWVIGDTPLDVRCARAIGAKAVAVGTGWHSMEELAASEPDYLIADFTQAEQLLNDWQ
jgi:phosphoglycolate phosphatase